MSSVSNGSTLQNGKWYYVSSSVTFSDRIHTDGEVNIILGDGATVNFQRGIEVGENDTLNVYDQKNGTGKMIAFSERFAYSGDQDEAAIGADKGAGGNMNFYGGIFEATTKRECRGAAIGGGSFGSGGRMIFYAGNYTINAIYGTSTGIGGGYHGRASRCSGEGIIIYGGTFDVSSFLSGAAIGSGEEATGSTGAIAIYGGSVTAKSRFGGAAIGGGKNGKNGPIYIYGGEVNALAYGDKTGAGIGGGMEKGGGYIEISGGVVVANSTSGGAGIGGGQGGSGGTVKISGGEVIAKRGLTSANAIGKGKGGSGSGTLNIGNKLMVNSGSDDTDA